MHRLTVVLLLLSLVLVVSGCSERLTLTSESNTEAQTALSSSEHGAWLGEGTFTSSYGTQSIKAQLELLPDKTYRFMVIEPRTLMMIVGLEKGNWERLDQELKLTPFRDQITTGTGKLGALNRAPKNYVSKALKVNGNNFSLQDDQMDLLFKPNPKATETLQQRGELK